MFHIFLHFVIPAMVVGVFFRRRWQWAYLILVATMVVDIDHLLATPIYDPQRCSIGFHPLHQLWMLVLYIGLTCFPKTRLVGLGLSIHMVLDAIDCQRTNGVWVHVNA